MLPSPTPPRTEAGSLEAAAKGELREVSPALARAVFGGGPPWVRDFADLRFEWRRWFAEILGTFFLVAAGAGSAIVEASHPGAILPPAQAVVPALMVIGLILAIGAVSGAHLNPVVSIAFALRGEFPWRRVPLYLLAQVAGAVLACVVLRGLLGDAGALGATLPGHGVSDAQAMGMEAILTFGLLSVILGTASGAQNVGALSAIAVGGFVALAGIGFGPISGASMNPVRSLGPDIVRGSFGHLWVYLAGPSIGMLAAVGTAVVLRGRGGDPSAARAAQGSLGTLVLERIVHDQAPRQGDGGGAAGGGSPGGATGPTAPNPDAPVGGSAGA
jgi:aquaporin Z